MATLNTSIEGQAVSKAYQSIVNSPGPANPSAASSPTYGQWAIFSVHAPLVSAFQHAGNQESVLRVFRTGEGEMADMVDEFSEGKIQYAFVKVRDPNTTLQKNVLIAWCGEGVPERTKGNFYSYTAAVEKIFHGSHVQVEARTDADLVPEKIVKRVQDSSGSKYSGGGAVPSAADAPKPPVATKPVFTPSRVGGGGNFNPLGSGRTRPVVTPSAPTDGDGWGEDAPQPTRSQLEKVAPAYQRTAVNMPSLQSQKQEPTRFQPQQPSNGNPDVVRGGYQPIGKVDIAAIRREAKEKGEVKDERPTTVKGSYEPVGKVDIAAIRARAQGPGGTSSQSPSAMSPSATGTSQRSSDGVGGGRISAMPKPKPAGNFGGSNFTGTRAPMPSSFDSQPCVPAAPQVGAASKTFADQGGKTPAQLWAEKKAQQGGPTAPAPEISRAIPAQTSGGSGGWQSGYSGKKWGPVQTTRTGASAVSSDNTGDAAPPPPASANREIEEPAEPASGGVSAMRNRFKNAQISTASGGSSSSVDLGSRPIPPRPAEEDSARPPSPPIGSRPTIVDTQSDDEEPLRPESPIRIAQPVARTAEPAPVPKVVQAEEEMPPAMPVRSLAQAAPAEEELEPEPAVEDHDTARAAGAEAANHVSGGHRAIAQYDYEKAEDNELELREGEEISGIEMVDEDWWMGFNAKGESGLFPSNYVELIEGAGAGAAPAAVRASEPAREEAAGASGGKTATAQYDYDAAEENELSFPEGAKIHGVVSFPSFFLRRYAANAANRNFRTRTGGSASTTGRGACSRRTTLSWISGAAIGREMRCAMTWIDGRTR